MLKGDNVALVRAGVYIMNINAAGWTVCGWGEWKGLLQNLTAGFSNTVTHFSYTLFAILIHSIYLLTPRSRVIFEKLTGFQLVKNFPTLYGTRRFITAFTSARHLSLPWASSIQSITPHPTSWRSIVKSSYLRLGSRLSLSLRFTHQNPVYVSPLSYTRSMPRTSRSFRIYHPNVIGWGVHIIKLLIT
jgi:hypothetical protein